MKTIQAAAHVSLADAFRQNYKPLTTGYDPSEYKMLERVIADMERSRIPYVLVAEDERHPQILSVFKK